MILKNLEIKYFIRNWKLEIGNLAAISAARAGIITDAPKISTVLYNALSFLLSVFGMLAIIGLIISAVLYLTAAGSETQIEKAKKAFKYSIVGIIIGFGGWILIKTIISLMS